MDYGRVIAVSPMGRPPTVARMRLDALRIGFRCMLSGIVRSRGFLSASLMPIIYASVFVCEKSFSAYLFWSVSTDVTISKPVSSCRNTGGCRDERPVLFA